MDLFGWIQTAFGTMLGWFESWSGSYAIALFLYALVFKLVFSPFAIFQQRSQIKNAKLQPKIAALRAKYAGRTDRATQQKLQQEIMELQQKEGSNPLLGCLPMILQLVLIIPLYAVIRNPLTYISGFSDDVIVNIWNTVNGLTEGAEGFVTKIGEIANNQIPLITKIEAYIANGEAHESLLSGIAGVESIREAIPDFHIFGVLNLAENPSFASIGTTAGWLLLIPVLVAFSQWFSMWLIKKFNPNSAAMAQGQDSQAQISMKIMDLVLPAMTLVMAFSVPSMLGVYWIYQSVLSVLQSFILSKVMPLPKYSEEDIKAIKKAQKEQQRMQREALKQQPKTKSLHYIDDDDYEELPEVKSEDEKKPSSKGFSSDIPEIKD